MICLVFQQLEIDYVIGETHKELLPDRSGPAAILRIFGVTGEGKYVNVHKFVFLLLIVSKNYDKNAKFLFYSSS